MEKGRLDRYLASGLPYLGPDAFGPWLDPAVRDPAALAAWLRPYPAEAMTACPVGAWVNNPRNEGPACLAPPA